MYLLESGRGGEQRWNSDRSEAGRVKVFFGSRRGGEQKRDSARGGSKFFSGRGGAGSKREIQLGASRAGEKFFLVGTRRRVKNSPHFGLWSDFKYSTN